MSKEVEIVIANATEFKPGGKYLICIDRNSATEEDAVSLLKNLKKAGISWAIALMTDGDPSTAVKVIEEA